VPFILKLDRTDAAHPPRSATGKDDGVQGEYKGLKKVKSVLAGTEAVVRVPYGSQPFELTFLYEPKGSQCTGQACTRRAHRAMLEMRIDGAFFK
jgi:hypothetical protein